MDCFYSGERKPAGALSYLKPSFKPMPITIEWPEIALRLALTVVAGTLIGEHFKPGARKSRGVVHLIGWAASWLCLAPGLKSPTLTRFRSLQNLARDPAGNQYT